VSSYNLEFFLNNTVHMITHLVFFKMLPEAEGASGAENAAKLVAMLEGLPARIPELLKLEAGTDFSNSPASYDVGLLTQFRTKEDLESYRVHPDHQEVVKFVQKTTSDRAVVDFEGR
jgi:hypothetical protein